MLSVDTFVGSEASFVSSAHLISGERDTILIDASFTKSDAQQLTQLVKTVGKRLTSIFITHAHPDHFLGLPVVVETFPEARVVATAAVADAMRTAAPEYHATYAPVFGDALADTYVLAEPLTGSELSVEGETRVLKIGPGEADVSSALYVPSLKAIATGDQIFSGVHVWLVQYRPQGSLKGSADCVVPARSRSCCPVTARLEGQNCSTRTNGTSVPSWPQQNPPPPKAEGIAKMLDSYPDYAMPVILDFGMQAAVEGKSYPQIMQDFLSGTP